MSESWLQIWVQRTHRAAPPPHCLFLALIKAERLQLERVICTGPEGALSKWLACGSPRYTTYLSLPTQLMLSRQLVPSDRVEGWGGGGSCTHVQTRGTAVFARGNSIGSVDIFSPFVSYNFAVFMCVQFSSCLHIRRTASWTESSWICISELEQSAIIKR